MAAVQCFCGTTVPEYKSFHRGFDLLTEKGTPEFVYEHFCCIPCRDEYIKQAPIYIPPPPKQQARVPGWGSNESY